MRMDSIPPPNVLASLNRVNERGDSAMLPTSHSSSNGGCGNAAKGNMEHYSLHHVFDTTPLSSLYTASLPPSLQRSVVSDIIILQIMGYDVMSPF